MAEQKRNTRTSKARTPQPVTDYGRVQPQAIELEEAVLGALMIEKDAYSLVSQTISQVFYFTGISKKIFMQGLTFYAELKLPLFLTLIWIRCGNSIRCWAFTQAGTTTMEEMFRCSLVQGIISSTRISATLFIVFLIAMKLTAS